METSATTTQRLHSSSTHSSTPKTYELKGPHQEKLHDFKMYHNFKIYCPFNIPLTSEAAGIRIIRNMRNLGLYYTLFVWIILFITLIPRRKLSLILLVIMTYVTTLYCLLLRACPNSVMLHKIIDKRFVLALLVFATVVQLVVTEAGIHLAVTIACAVPLVLVHAVLWVNHYAFETDQDGSGCVEDLAPLAGHNEGGAKGEGNV